MTRAYTFSAFNVGAEQAKRIVDALTLLSSTSKTSVEFLDRAVALTIDLPVADGMFACFIAGRLMERCSKPDPFGSLVAELEQIFGKDNVVFILNEDRIGSAKDATEEDPAARERDPAADTSQVNREKSKAPPHAR